jgi:peptidoglycan biosynthesis protein MviN/MurJ (putative lipid II flippase)
MTPWIALLLGLVVVAILAAYDVKPMVLVILAAACSLGALVSVFLGAVGANDDLGSSWSDSGPRLMLRWAASFVIIGGTSLFALLWPRLSRRQRDRS